MKRILASNPAVLATISALILTSTVVSALILIADPSLTARAFLLVPAAAACGIGIWHFARKGQLTLKRLDEFAWMVLISHTVIVSRVRDPRILAEEHRLSREIIAEMAIWGLLIAYSGIRLLRDSRHFQMLRGTAARLAVLLLGLACFSISYASSRLITTAWCVKLLSIMMCALLLFDPTDRAESLRRFLRATVGGLALMIIQFVVLGAISPQAALDQSRATGIWRVGGYLLPSTQLSPLGGMIVVLALIDWLARRSTPRHLVFPAVSGLLMVSTLGRTGMLATLVALLIVLAAFRRFRVAVVATLAAAVILTLLPGVADASWEVISRRQSQQELASLTGRVQLWETAVELIAMKPILGWGYVSGSRVAFLTAFRWWPAIHTHNMFLEILLTLGLVGGAALGLLVSSVVSSTVHFLRRRWSAGRPDDLQIAGLKVLALASIVLVDGLFSAGISGAPRFETAIFIGCTFAADCLRAEAFPK